MPPFREMKAIKKVAELRRMVAPASLEIAQLTCIRMANRRRARREEIVTELESKLQILKDRTGAFVISKSLVGALELESLCTEVKGLWRDTKITSEEIIMFHPPNMPEIDEMQAATDTVIGNVIYPLEAKIVEIITLCREEKEKADVAARAATTIPTKCRICSKVDHLAKDCRSRGGHRVNVVQYGRNGNSSCPLCKQTHTYTMNRDGVDSATRNST